MNLNETLAIVSVGGFATQRSLELLDPLFISLSKLEVLKIFGDEKTAKGWCMAIAGFGIGLAIALLDTNAAHALPGLHPAASDVVIGLAISMGSNASNSLVKFAEHVKESRKKEVEPIPDVAITPKTVELSPSAKMRFLASVSLTDNKLVTWRVLEVTDGGSIAPGVDGSGEYTAPARPGTYHVAAISQANPAATATAVITVKAAA